MSAWRAPPPRFAWSPSPTTLRSRECRAEGDHAMARRETGVVNDALWGGGGAPSPRDCGRLGRDGVKDYTEEKTCRVHTARNSEGSGAAARPLETAPDRIRRESNELEG